MLTTLKFANLHIQLFCIAGSKYYVTRSNAFSQCGGFGFVDSQKVAVFAPTGMSYQQAAQKAAQEIGK